MSSVRSTGNGSAGTGPGTAVTRAAVIGLDLGGTKIAAALFAEDGTVLARHTRPTPARNGAAAVLDALAAAAAEVDPGRRATVLGIAAAGVVDPRSGMVTSATDSISGWAGTALAAGLADRTGLAVACDNDVRATAGPELAALPDRHGSLLFAAVGTGVGGALAVDGRMLHGAAGIAGHLGHLPSAEAAGLPCTCGATGHLEVIASGPGITAHYERLTGAPVDRLETVAARAADGERAAVHAVTTGPRPPDGSSGASPTRSGPTGSSSAAVSPGSARCTATRWQPPSPRSSCHRCAGSSPSPRSSVTTPPCWAPPL